jgi:hypothetical protein
MKGYLLGYKLDKTDLRDQGAEESRLQLQGWPGREDDPHKPRLHPI